MKKKAIILAVKIGILAYIGMAISYYFFSITLTRQDEIYLFSILCAFAAIIAYEQGYKDGRTS